MSFRMKIVMLASITFYTAMGQKYETQPFRVVKNLQGLEIRYYPPVMKIQSDNNFGDLFGYISGKNQDKAKIAMTTPVYMKDSDGQDVMEFVLPNSFKSVNTPTPESPGVRVFESKPGYFIAIGFGGYAKEKSKVKQTERLIALAKQHQLKLIGKPLLLVYNSPFRFFNRKNEMLFEIAYQE